MYPVHGNTEKVVGTSARYSWSRREGGIAFGDGGMWYEMVEDDSAFLISVT